SMWSRIFDIVDGDFHYHVNFDAAFFYSSADSTHHTVTVINGQGSGDMLHWYTTSAWGPQYNGAYVAHEVGHMFSLYDEYSGGAVNPSDPLIDYSSIMGSLASVVYERHYQPFLDWLQPEASGRELYLDDYDPSWVNPEIPEPATLFLLGFGAVILKKLKYN
ncbi:MAG: PEP-CTERM sorting domain-containing protein, partial [Phycisphaerae bacterium]|nr:PEP-CTERM sorting domain-containing protein [Phycisphaerae bacterium]